MRSPTARGLLLAALLVLSAVPPAVHGWPWSSSSDADNKDNANSDPNYSPDSNADSDVDSLASEEPQQWIPNGYAVGMQYNYKFDSQLASSLTEGEQFAVTRMSANVRMQITSDAASEKTAIVQCEQVQVALAQMDLRDVTPARMELARIDDMEEQASIAPKLQQTLQLAFEAKFSPSTGRVKSLRFQDSDQPWSENIKRSVVNLLQVVGAKNASSVTSGIFPTQSPPQKQQKDQTADSNADEQQDQQQQQQRKQPKPAPTSYKQAEKTIEGDCEVAYSIDDGQQKGGRKHGRSSANRQQSSGEGNSEREEQDQDQQQQQSGQQGKKGITTVTKAVNFQKCRRRPELRYNYLRHSEDYTASNAIEDGQAPYEKEAVDVSSVYSFQVGKPSAQQLSSTSSAGQQDDENGGDDSDSKRVVLQAQAVSQLSANILDSDRPALSTYALVKLQLESVISWQKSGEQWATPANLKQPSTLVHSTETDAQHERFVTQGDGAYLQPAINPYPSTETLPNIAINVMKEMMKAARVGTAKFLDMREEAPRHLEHFVGTLRLCTQPQLKDVRQKLAPLVQSNDQAWKNSKFLRDIFSDALAMACTQPSIAEFFELVKAKHVSPSKASRAVRHLGNCRLVSQKQLDQVMEICDSEVAKDYQPLRQSCLLTWGTMAGAMCASNMVNSTNVWEYEKRQEAVGGVDVPVHPIGGHSDSDKWASELAGEKADKSGRICSSSKRRELSSKLASIYDNASGVNATAEKIVAIKALGNMGLTASLPKLKAIIESQSEEQLVRWQAVDALRHIAHNAPRAVQHVVLPVFQDKSEAEEIRTAAFYQLLHSMPGQGVMDTVIAAMQKETNQHIQAFVQSSIREMAESRKHFDQKTARVLKAALTKLKALNAYDESAEIHSASGVQQFSFFSGDFTRTPSKHSQGGKPTEFGAGIITSTAYSKESPMVPRWMSVGIDSLFDGRLTGDVAQITMQQQNGEVALQRLAEQVETKQFDQVITRTRRSSSNSQRRNGDSGQGTTSTYNPYEILKRFLAKHRPFSSGSGGANSADASDERRKPKMLISARSYGQDVDFTLVDERFVQRFIRNGKFDISVLESSKNTTDQQYHHYSASLGPEYKVKVPSVAGVPIVVSKSYPSLYACEGSTKVEFDPFGSDKIRGLRFSTNMQAQVASSVVNQMEAFSPIFTSGTSTRHSGSQKLPLNFVAKLGKETAQAPVPTLDVELHLPKKEDLVIKQINSRPTTFTRVWPNSGRAEKYIERNERTLYLADIERDHVEGGRSITCPLTGLVMEVRGHFSRRDPSCANSNAQWIVGGENSMELRIRTDPRRSPLAAGKLRFRISMQQTPTDKEIDGKASLLKLFDNRRELFIDSSEQEKQLVKQFVQEYSPRMNTLTKMRINIDAEQTPQQRSALLELTTFCDKHNIVCTAASKLEWKRGAASDDVDPSALESAQRQGYISGSPYHITVRSNVQLSAHTMQGVYVGGIRSQHVLGHADFQLSGTDFAQPQGGKAAVSVYARPSAMRVSDWQMMLEEARQAGIGDYENSARQSRIPHVLRVNDAAAVWEFQSGTPSKELMRQGYYRMKSLPQSRVHFEPDLDDQLWDEEESPSQRRSGEAKIYTRLIVDEVTVAGKPALRCNLTISDDPYSLVKARGLRKLGQKPTGNHIRVSTNKRHDEAQYDDLDDEDMDGYSFSSTRRSSAVAKKRRIAGQSKRASLFDVFSSNSADPSSYAECRMDAGRYVRSFDGQSYVIPLVRDCNTIMAKDCSPAREFEVLAKKVGGPQQERIHVQFNMHHQRQQPKKFELFLGPTPSQHQHPNNDGQQQQQRLPQMVVKLNSEVLSKEDFEAHSIRVIDPNDGYTGSSGGGGKKLPLIYIVQCPSTGSELEFNGEQLRIRINKRFANKQCGVCGHYNLDKSDELMMVVGGEGTTQQGGQRDGKQQKKLASSLREFHSNYIDKAANQQQGVCDAEAVASRIKQASGKRAQPQQQGSEEEGRDDEDDSYTFGRRDGKRGQQKQQESSSGEEWKPQQDTDFFDHYTAKRNSQRASRRQNQQQQRDENRPEGEEPIADNTNNNGDSSEEDEVFGYPAARKQGQQGGAQSASGEAESQQGGQKRQQGGKQKRKPKLATKVIEEETRVCFSYRPVPTCPANTRPATSGTKQSQQQRINFLCLPRDSPQVRKWRRDIRASSAGGRDSETGVAQIAEETGPLDDHRFDGQQAEQKRMWVPRECIPVQ